MSRSSFWRQEAPANDKTWHAEDIFRAACDEGRNHKGALPIWGDETSFHFNPLLLKNCIQSSYFQKCCEKLPNWSAVIDEIYYEVKNVCAFQGHQKQPSTAFCLLLRLLTLRMTSHQLDLTLKHADSPYIRAIGFLYLRYVGPPDQVYEWISPYLYDEEEFTVLERVEHKREGALVCIGSFVRNVFQSRDYYGQTTLPRWPLAIEKTLGIQLLAADTIAERAMKHSSNPSRIEHFMRIGSEVMALYGDDENPVTWYKAVVDRVITRDEVSNGSVTYKFPRFVVTFTEYGNTETVHLGELEIVGDTSFNESSRKDAGVKHGYDKTLEEELRRREKEQVTASERGKFHRRPHSTKQNMQSAAFRSNRVDENDDMRRSRDHQVAHRHDDRNVVFPTQEKERTDQAEPPRKRSSEEIAAIAEKKRRLAAKYG
jgi:pre-mRNA-splicing factor 38B